MENTIQTLKWDSDDCVRFNIDESEIGDSVFNEDNLPWRLWDAAHENKNLPRKIHDVSKCNSFSFIVFFQKSEFCDFSQSSWLQWQYKGPGKQE